MLRAALLAAVLSVVAGCAPFSPVGTDKFRAEARETFGDRSDIVYYATGTWGQPGVYFVNGVPMPRRYSAIIALTEGGLIVAGEGFQPKYTFRPFSKLGSFEPIDGVFGTAAVQEKGADGKVRTFIIIDDDGISGTDSKQKTLAFYQMMQELMAKDRAKLGTQLQSSPSRL